MLIQQCAQCHVSGLGRGHAEGISHGICEPGMVSALKISIAGVPKARHVQFLWASEGFSLD
jgi:hypothetical protein